MFFNKFAFRLLMKENARLRRDVRERDARIKEMIDTLVYHRSPERVAQAVAPYEPASDALSKAYADAIKEADSNPPVEIW